jgi:hypothetical protein
MIQPWPFFFLATFLAAFFFFFAMEMAPYHEHPEKVLTSQPPDALGRGRDDVSKWHRWRSLTITTTPMRELWWIHTKTVKRKFRK